MKNKGKGTGNGQFDSPRRVDADSSDNVYVDDTRLEQTLDERCDKAIALQNALTWQSRGDSLNDLGEHDEALFCYDNSLKYYSMIKIETLSILCWGAINFYLGRITQSIDDGNIGTAKQLLDKIIEIKERIEEHKIPEKEVRFDYLIINFLVELLKKKQPVQVLELLEILDKSKISRYIGFLFPLKILAEYLQSKDEDILNRQRPEVKGIIKEVLAKISS